MIKAMFDYRAKAEAEVESCWCKPLENVRTSEIGFRVVLVYDPEDVDEHKEFWTHLSTGAETPWNDLLMTHEGKDWVAKHDGSWVWVDPAKVFCIPTKVWSTDRHT
jgi:hypothetical protein